MKSTMIICASFLLAAAAMSYDIHHPNIRDAYQSIDVALRHIGEAQHLNKGVEFGGHANAAIDMLKHAQQELIAADQYNDTHQHK